MFWVEQTRVETGTTIRNETRTTELETGTKRLETGTTRQEPRILEYTRQEPSWPETRTWHQRVMNMLVQSHSTLRIWICTGEQGRPPQRSTSKYIRDSAIDWNKGLSLWDMLALGVYRMGLG